jgi:hypothetical protein
MNQHLVGSIIIPPLHRRGYTVLPLSVRPSIRPSFRPSSVRPSVRRPSVRPRYISSHFSQQLLMAEIWYLVTSFIYVCHIVGSVFGPVRFLLSVCRLRWFLYTHWTHMRGYHKWALAHSSSCCIIHIGTLQFLYKICLFDFHFGLCYSRVVFTLEQELPALPEYLSASLVILWVSCCSILSFQCSAMSTIIFLFVSFYLCIFFDDCIISLLRFVTSESIL